jgi:hypothetical protein
MSPLLPSPPLHVAGSIFSRAAFLLLLSLPMSALFAWELATEVPQEVSALARESGLWEHDVPAVEGSFKGEVTTRKFIFKSFALTVSYVDQSGARSLAVGRSSLRPAAGCEGARRRRRPDQHGAWPLRT